MIEEDKDENTPEIQESYNADDKHQVNKARKRAARKKLIQEEAIRRIMGDKDCRAWIAGVLSFCDIDGNPHVPGEPDSTAFNCGMANAGRMIWCEIKEAAPESAVMMLKEASENEKI